MDLIFDDLPPSACAAEHVLPPLPYEYGALEPFIDARTLRLHHDVHHGTYVEKLNKIQNTHQDIKGASAPWLLRNAEKIPEAVREEVKFYAGGHLNHALFWRAMRAPVAASEATPLEPTGALREALLRDFGSFAQFKTAFEEAGRAVQGSGWVWLTHRRGEPGKLEICTTQVHVNPMLDERFPILLNDVWEHAYYLQYESRRAEYLKAWWSVVNWDEAGQRLAQADNSAVPRWEGEGGQILDVAS